MSKQQLKVPKIISKPFQALRDPLNLKDKKIGLALGSGGAKGLAHIGVLKVLEKEGIKIDMIAGSSIGAVIGGFYGVHRNAAAVEKLAEDFDLKKFFDIGVPRSGLLKGDKLEEYLRKQLNDLRFKDLPFPLFIVATDLLSDREIIFNSGDLTKAIRASFAVPGFFYPVQNKNRILIDGAWKNPLPVKLLKDNGCDIVIAVNLASSENETPIYESATKIKSKKSKLPNILNISTKSSEIIDKELAYYKGSLKRADILIEPEVSSNDFLKFGKYKELIKAGEIAAEKKIKKIKRLARRQTL